MNIKKELIIGIAGSIIFIGTIMFYVNQYKSNTYKLSSDKALNQNSD